MKARIGIGLGAVVLVAVAVIATLTLSGGPSGDAKNAVASLDGSDNKTTATTAKLDQEKAGLEFTKCMREHGVDMPDPQSGEDGGMVFSINSGSDDGSTPPDKSIVDAANKACESLMPKIEGLGAGQDEAMKEQALKFAKCMRENGINVPDPTFAGGGGMVKVENPDGSGEASTGPRVDPDDPKFQAAQKACAQFMKGPDGKSPAMTGTKKK